MVPFILGRGDASLLCSNQKMTPGRSIKGDSSASVFGPPVYFNPPSFVFNPVFLFLSVSLFPVAESGPSGRLVPRMVILYCQENRCLPPPVWMFWRGGVVWWRVVRVHVVLRQKVKTKISTNYNSGGGLFPLLCHRWLSDRWVVLSWVGSRERCPHATWIFPRWIRVTGPLL